MTDYSMRNLMKLLLWSIVSGLAITACFRSCQRDSRHRDLRPVDSFRLLTAGGDEIARASDVSRIQPTLEKGGRWIYFSFHDDAFWRYERVPEGDKLSIWVEGSEVASFSK